MKPLSILAGAGLLLMGNATGQTTGPEPGSVLSAAGDTEDLLISPATQATTRPGQRIIAAGNTHSLALKKDGTVWGWGNNGYGQLGNGVFLPGLSQYTPVQAKGLTGIVDIAVGSSHSLALRNDGTVWAFGLNNYGQLGVGNTLNYSTPVPVHGPDNVGYLTQVVNVEAGDDFSFAVKQDGTVWAWGHNNSFQLGEGTTTDRKTPVPVQLFYNGMGVVGGLAGGGHHGLAIKDGAVWSWGDNRSGQLGTHSNDDEAYPVPIYTGSGLTGVVTAVDAGDKHSLALTNGTVWSWGEGGHGQLGLHSDNDHTVPYQVHGPDNVDYLTGIIQVAAGANFSLGLKDDGSLWSWGEGGHGQLGLHSDNDHTVPYQVHGPDNEGYLSGVTNAAAGDYHSLAVTSDGSVWAWGDNSYGQLGIGNRDDHTVPYQVHGPDNVGYLTDIGPTSSGTPPPGASPPQPPSNPPTWRDSVLHELFLKYPEAFTEVLIANLEASGFQVSEGYPKLWTEADCAYSYPVYRNCFGNNPAAPYVVPVLKSWPEEYVDPAMENGLGMTRPGYSSTYRLDPREAIILFGRMPPPARYIGLQSWIWTAGWVSEKSPWDEDKYEFYADAAGPLIQYLFATVPPVNFATEPPVYGDRVQSVSSLDNNINNVVMEKQSGPPWDQMRYFVITPDKVTDGAVRDALVSLGVDEGEIFTERIPETFEGNPIGPLGLGKDAVDFFTNLRYAMPDDEQAAGIWRESLPLTVLRVRRPSSGPAPEPYGDRVADDRPGVDEVNDTALRNGLSSLIDAVIVRAQSQGLALETAPEEMRDLQSDLGNFGPDCREIGMNCLGDNQDASYFLFTPQPLDTGRIYAAVGTLATETGNGTYVGLSVNDASLLKGVKNIPDTQLEGSAKSYVGEVPNPDTLEKFFVHFFTRDCAAIADLTDGACTTITTDMVPLAGDDEAPGDPELHGMFSMAVRAYVVPGFERGPDPKLQLRPQSLTFVRGAGGG